MFHFVCNESYARAVTMVIVAMVIVAWGDGWQWRWRQEVVMTGGRATMVVNAKVIDVKGGRQGRVAVIAKASSGSSESSTSLDIVQSVRSFWDTPEDRLALFGLGFASVVALWASLTVVTAIDKLPVVPGVFELIGILFTTWFTYRYLLFKPDRKELFQIINKSLADVLGK